MIGPLFQREALRAGGRAWGWALRWAWVTTAFFFSVVPMLASGSMVSVMADGWLQFLVIAQFLLVSVAAPILTAGTVTEEKARGTLPLLLATALTPLDILLGKLLGRTMPLWLLLLVSVPLLCFHAGVSDLNPPGLLALVLLPVLVLLAGGTAGLLASVWSKTTAQALLIVYFAAIGVALAVEWPGSPLNFLSPLEVLRAVWGDDYPFQPSGGRQRFVLWPRPGLVAWRLGWFVLAWGGVVAGGLVLAAWRLRPVYLAQLEARGRKRGRHPWRAHPPVGDDPLCWKECYVEGLSTQTGRGRTPFWLELGVVFALWAGVLVILCGDSIRWEFEKVFPTNGTPPQVMPEFPFFVQGLTVAFVGSVLVGVRGAGAIAGEKQRQTWETLLLTDLRPRELVRGKLRGILRAFWPYLAAALLPALLLSWTGGLAAVFWPLFWGVAAWIVASFLAAVGISHSATQRTTWGRLAFTLATGFLVGLLTLVVWVPCVGLVFVPRGNLGPSTNSQEAAWFARIGLAVTLLVLWGLLHLIAIRHLHMAENAIRPRRRRQFLLYDEWGP
jgi:ABC-type transport system involved in multi-copper enzyme maturation permease subunit